VSPAKSYRATAWRPDAPESTLDGLRGGLPVVGDDGLEQAAGGDVPDTDASWDGCRGKLVGSAAGRGGKSEQNTNA